MTPSTRPVQRTPHTAEPVTFTAISFEPKVFSSFDHGPAGLHIAHDPRVTSSDTALGYAQVFIRTWNARSGTISSGGFFIKAPIPAGQPPLHATLLPGGLLCIVLDEDRLSVDDAMHVIRLVQSEARVQQEARP
ncbi:hypothetical protein GCM10023347_33630 [Streptomyces chumphonensis]|uniref:Uncharacterized protein n=1 Tax=Streptomyces chumphonensis TaxID=1214925 RepID=A0A927EYC8_9ACTN|nr:hypothetical protein [Streptomyces chumphonensis]MBD3931968.1 hypothetical protein [Streptomyces chumphonensis]